MPRDWTEAALLTPLPKEIAMELQPDAEGGWTASIAGIPGTSISGKTEEEAQALVLKVVLPELLQARCELVHQRLAILRRQVEETP